jgi:hypothetical protein
MMVESPILDLQFDDHNFGADCSRGIKLCLIVNGKREKDIQQWINQMIQYNVILILICNTVRQITWAGNILPLQQGKQERKSAMGLLLPGV